MHQPTFQRAMRDRARSSLQLAKVLCLGGLLAGASWSFAAAHAGAAPMAASAAAPATSASIQAKYERERANCMAGKTNQDQQTCLKEAGAARDEARKGVLSNGAAPGDLQRNALDRCKTLPAGEQTACRDRVTKDATGTSMTTTTGSVQSGGILRERVEVVPATPPVKAKEPLPTK